MRKVFLFVGFNNWGKTRLLSDLFGVKAFRKGKSHQFSGHEFLVIPKSNDDLGKAGFIREYNDRLNLLNAAGDDVLYIAGAFCPTREQGNMSIDIIRELFVNDEVHLLLLEYKWCGHAKLICDEIEKHYKVVENITVHEVSAKTPELKLSSIRRLISSYLS